MIEYADKLFKLLGEKTDLNAIEKRRIILSIIDNPEKIEELEKYLRSDNIDRNYLLTNFLIISNDRKLTKEDYIEVEEANKETEKEFNKRCAFYSDWKRKKFDDAQPCMSYLKSLDIFNKKIKCIKAFGADQLISKQTFVDEYNNEYLKGAFDLRKKVSLSDFPSDAKMIKSVSSEDPIMLIFEDDSTLDIWPSDYGVVEVSSNELINHKEYSMPNYNINEMLSEIIGKKIIDVSYKAIDKDSQMFDWFVKNKSVSEPIRYLIFKLDNGDNIIISNYTIFVGSLEKGGVLVPLRKYLECINNYEKYFD